MDKWKEIWNNKKDIDIENLQDLINIAGFETSGLKASRLVKFVVLFKNYMNIKENESVYEVGCGSGAILSILHELGMDVGGLDYSMSLVNIANQLHISEDIIYDSAENLEPSKKYDYVIANSCFQYFPSLEYAENVVDLMMEKSNKKSIAIFDVNDATLKELYFKKRRAAEPDYDTKYEGFEHLFIHPEFWADYAAKHNLQLLMEKQTIKDYKNSEFRYNIYLSK